MNQKVNKIKVLKELYQKWVLEEEDAVYYGTAYDAVDDFKKLFKVIKYEENSKGS